MRCQCESCTILPAPTYTRAWLRQCLIRSIVASPERREFFLKYEQHHGKAEALKLAAEVRQALREG